MAGQDHTEQFLKSWWQWKNSLPNEQRWMADAIGWSAAHAADVQGYQAASQWSWDQMSSWLHSQKAQDWQQWSKGWKTDARWSS
jgi:hypothetical protein